MILDSLIRVAWPILSGIMIFAVGANALAEPVVINPDFEADGKHFNVPTAWVPFGDAKREGTHEGNWKALVADLQPRHEGGYYQVIPDVTPGRHYRLKVDARSGHPHLQTRIGLALNAPGRTGTITWSDPHDKDEWATLEVEGKAGRSDLTIVLQVTNINPEHMLFQAAMFDNVRLEEADEAGTKIVQGNAPPRIPPAHDVTGCMANLWSLAWPKPGVRTFLAGTHDPNPDGNSDFDRIEGKITENGTTWAVLKSLDGPGAIVRVWMTQFPQNARLRVDADGSTFLNQPVRDFFGSPAPFGWPLANRTSGAWLCHAPIPFNKSARVMISDHEPMRFYWQITHQRFDSTVDTEAKDLARNRDDERNLALVQDQWRRATMNPKPPWPGTHDETATIDLPANGTATVWQHDGPGMIDALWIDLPGDEEDILQGVRLRATWDDAPEAQVDAPFGLFFNVAYGRRIARGLLTGMAPPLGAYCYYPMPFAQGARIELYNATTNAIERIRCRVRWVDLKNQTTSPMRFHATHLHDPEAGKGKLFVPLDLKGRGHLVGLSVGMATASGATHREWHFLEGDEYIWVDGEQTPSTAGTGTEDYFSCGWYFMGGPITLPAVGAPEIDRERLRLSAYRLHVPDWVPFDESIRFGLEVGDATHSPTSGDYDTVACYYLDAQSR